jgi:hypothetical protein
MRLALVEDPSLVLTSARGEFLHDPPIVLTLDEGDVRRGTTQKRRPGQGRKRHGALDAVPVAPPLSPLRWCPRCRRSRVSELRGKWGNLVSFDFAQRKRAPNIPGIFADSPSK